MDGDGGWRVGGRGGDNQLHFAGKLRKTQVSWLSQQNGDMLLKGHLDEESALVPLVQAPLSDQGWLEYI